MSIPIELVHGLPRKELIEKIHFHHRQGEVAERALAFYLLQMEETKAYLPFPDAAQWARKSLDGCTRADRLILLARRLEELPEIDAAFAAGEVSWTKVREIARVATPQTERFWIDLARRANCREVEAEVARTKRGDEPGKPSFRARRRKYYVKVPLSGDDRQGRSPCSGGRGPGAGAS